MNIAILGYGSQGASAFEYFHIPKHQITICDENTDLKVPEAVATRLGKNYLENLDSFDLIIRSPSIHPRDIAKANPNSPNLFAKVTSNTNIFIEACPSQNIIGVTGTKGKGTTSTLIAAMLKSAGYTVHLGGNIGTPPLEMLKNNIQPNDWVVLELANFQLIDIKYSPPIAVCLMIVPEHMDWHSDFEEYIEAKRQLFKWQKPSDTAVYFNDNEHSKAVAGAGEGRKIPYFAAPGAHVDEGTIMIDGTIICNVAEIKLRGRHNWQNVCAAITAVWQVTQNVDAIKAAVQTTEGLPFRLELIAEVGGVKYVNDSFGTTPETAIVALQAYTEPKIVILGGSDKGASFDELAQAVKDNNVRKVITIGIMSSSITEALHNVGYQDIVQGGSSMPIIVAQAQAEAQSGDVVLLSTGCASLDMFKNYKDRGEQFNQAVRSLA